MSAVPLTTTRSLAVPSGSASTSKREPGSNTRSPATRKVPMELPGASAPPARTVVSPTVPVPPSVPPAATVMADPAISASTARRPARTVQDRAAALPPVRRQVPAPVFS
ncbi:Uncharacterised protein [Bordetella pertussis]|nr:Uncharacterised protein [Bordetella pertussis]CFL90805.1 Uncharacterised protein [Bordetella pertussis]CFM03847.1 Uncharacterised protein [Bordetella pertussis]CFM38888.1 Uncharacterised protein [Bordetella pertussis]CFM67583.1 Uncharacterised protein [Bordetella pertussis]